MPLGEGEAVLSGKYRILQLIGEGAMARVWLAEEPEFGERQVAIKEPRTDLLPEDLQDVQRRFHQEVEMAKLLEESHVPQVIRGLTVELMPDGARLLVMEYAAGGSLADRIHGHLQGMPVEQAMQTTIDICQALQAFHGLPVMPVHRDIKPSNILFASQGRAYLADFGLCELPGRSSRSRLQGGPHPGTPLYMAPEQARSPEPLTPAADIFALGCVFFEMLTGKPYKRVGPRGMRPSKWRPDVPAWLDRVVAGALAEDPLERYQNAEQMARALEQGETGAKGRTLVPRREAGEGRGLGRAVAILRRVISPVLRRRGILISLVVFLVASVYVALVFLSRPVIPAIVHPIATAIAEYGERRATAIVEREQVRATATAGAEQLSATRAAATAQAEHPLATQTAHAARLHATATAEAEQFLARRAAATAEAEHLLATQTAEAGPSAVWERIQNLKLVEQLSVPADGSVVATQALLQKGALYTIVAYGEFDCRFGGRVDPLCDAHEDSRIFLTIAGSRHVPGLLADAQKHIYAYRWIGGGQAVFFSVRGSTDFTGYLTVEIREGLP